MIFPFRLKQFCLLYPIKTAGRQFMAFPKGRDDIISSALLRCRPLINTDFPEKRARVPGMAQGQPLRKPFLVRLVTAVGLCC